MPAPETTDTAVDTDEQKKADFETFDPEAGFDIGDHLLNDEDDDEPAGSGEGEEKKEKADADSDSNINLDDLEDDDIPDPAEMLRQKAEDDEKSGAEKKDEKSDEAEPDEKKTDDDSPPEKNGSEKETEKDDAEDDPIVEGYAHPITKQPLKKSEVEQLLHDGAHSRQFRRDAQEKLEQANRGGAQSAADFATSLTGDAKKQVLSALRAQREQENAKKLEEKHPGRQPIHPDHVDEDERKAAEAAFDAWQTKNGEYLSLKARLEADVDDDTLLGALNPQSGEYQKRVGQAALDSISSLTDEIKEAGFDPDDFRTKTVADRLELELGKKGLVLSPTQAGWFVSDTLDREKERKGYEARIKDLEQKLESAVSRGEANVETQDDLNDAPDILKKDNGNKPSNGKHAGQLMRYTEAAQALADGDITQAEFNRMRELAKERGVMEELSWD